MFSVWFFSHLVYNPASHTHAIQDGYIDDSWHASIVDGLGAVGPHIGAFCQVYVARAETETSIRQMLAETCLHATI